MDTYLPMLQASKLFSNCAPTEIQAVLGCLTPKLGHYAQEETICPSGTCITGVGLVLAGEVRLEREDLWGNRSLLEIQLPGDIFGAACACLEQEPLRYRVAAGARRTTILFLEVQKLIQTCGNACQFHQRLIRNYLQLLAHSALQLNRKLEHTSRRTTREKLLSYLAEQSRLSGSLYFSIPMNRQELADYLAVDRSAMSAELSKLRREGLLDYDRNHFRLRKPGGAHVEITGDHERH